MKSKNHALYLAITAMFAALLFGGKQALAVLPNVEIVTLVTALCAYVWGLGVCLPAVLVFVMCQIAYYGINTWIVSYVVYWNLVAVAFWLLSKLKISKGSTIIIATATAVILTAFFGVLTSAVDVCIGYIQGQGFYFDFDNFSKRFVAMYLAGVPFYVTQIVCNLALFVFAFLPLVKLNQKAKLKLFGE